MIIPTKPTVSGIFGGIGGGILGAHWAGFDVSPLDPPSFFHLVF